MGPGGMMPPIRQTNDKLKPKKPKKLKEIPAYLKELIGGFFGRLFYIFQLVWGTKKWIFFAMMLVAVLKGVLPVVGALISADLLNALTEAYHGNVALGSIIYLLVFQFVYIFINKIMTNIDKLVTRLSGELVSNHIKLKILYKAKEVDIGRFDIPEFYERLENANREASTRPIQILSSTFSTLSTIISLLSFVAILWNVSPFAPFIIVFLGIPSAVLNFKYRQKNVNYMRHRSKDRRQMAYYSDLMVNKDIVKEVRLFGLSDEFINRYKSVFSKYFAGLKKLIIRENVWGIVLSVFTTIANCLLFLYVAYMVTEGKLRVGDYSLYTGALNSITSGVNTIITSTATIFEGTLFIENVIAFMKDKKTVVSLLDSPRIPKKNCGHTIEFKNVSFKYPGSKKYVLKNINVKMNAGETVVLVGLNGAGKTTLIKLLTR